VGVVAAVALTLRQRVDATRHESASEQVRVNPRDRVRLVKMDAVRPAQPTPVPPQEPSS
jgi:NADH-quinone oxidoreductase subunit J